MNQKKIEEVFSDEVFVTSLLKMDTAEEVQAALQEKGLVFSVQEICQIRDGLIAYANGELSESDLDQVAGGLAITTLFAIVCGAISAICVGIELVHEKTLGRW